MTQAPGTLPAPTVLDFERTLILAIELSNTSWVLAAQIPGLPGVKAKRSIGPTPEALMAAIEGYCARAGKAGRNVERVVAVYEAGRSGFWLVRWLAKYGIETHVIQPSSVPADRRARRAKSDGIDAELLPRTLLAWRRVEPRVCSMVPVPAEADEDARRRVRERAELIAERSGLVNRIGAVLAALGAGKYNPLRRDRRQRLGELRTALGDSLPTHARAKIVRMLDRLELLLIQITELEQARDAVLEDENPDRAAGTSNLPSYVAPACRAPPFWCARGSCANSPMARHSGPTPALRPRPAAVAALNANRASARPETRGCGP